VRDADGVDLQTHQQQRDATTIVITQALVLVLLTLVVAVVVGFLVTPVLAPLALVAGWSYALVFLVRHRRP